MKREHECHCCSSSCTRLELNDCGVQLGAPTKDHRMLCEVCYCTTGSLYDGQPMGTGTLAVIIKQCTLLILREIRKRR